MPHYSLPAAAGRELIRIHGELTGALTWRDEERPVDREKLAQWRDEMGAAIAQFDGPRRRRSKAAKDEEAL